MTGKTIALLKLGRDEKGTGALELGLALPMLLLLLAGMIDMSRFISGRIDVEQAAIEATDFALAVRPQDGGNTEMADIRRVASRAAGVEIGNATAVMTVECDGVQQSSWRSFCTSSEDQARLINVTVSKTIDTVFDWTGLANALGWGSGMDAQITVTGDSVVRIQ